MEIAGVKKGIISVSQLLQKGYKVSFERNHCKIINAQGLQIPVMELNGQYWIRARPRSPPQATTTRTTTTQLMPVAAEENNKEAEPERMLDESATARG